MISHIKIIFMRIHGACKRSTLNVLVWTLFSRKLVLRKLRVLS